MINKMRNWTATASLFLFLLPLASAQITPNIWKKFIGEPAPAATPDLIDYSYAGYKNGEEAIPETFTQPTFNVIDYGAVPDDGESDTAGIKAALKAANNSRRGGIVFFPHGQYDVLLDGETMNSIVVSGDNVIVKGSGAVGAADGGTTIKMHNKLTNDNRLFLTRWRANGQSSSTRVKGTFPRGTRHFDVENVSHLRNRRFIEIRASKLLGDDWSQYSSRPITDMPMSYTNIRKGIGVYEIHEIDRIDGDRVYVKAPVLTHLNSNFKVNWRDMTVGVGFEDLHIDGNLQERYRHLVQEGRGGITLWHTAHSWIRRCRFSNTINAFGHRVSYNNSALGIILDGRFGHYPGSVTASTYCFIGLLEDHTDNGMWHGVSVAQSSAGTVVWEINGKRMRGPDTHGSQPRHTLFDNYNSISHHASGGAIANLPHHLDGYTRWNNNVSSSRTFDLWTPGGYSFAVTQANIIGYKTGGGSKPRNAYVEGFGTRVSPDSLYEAQLQRRLGTLPAWVDAYKEKHSEFIEPPARTYSIGLAGLGDLTNQTQDASAGVTYYFTVTNTSNRYDTIKLTTSGDATATLSHTSVSLAPGASSQVTITVAGSALTVPGEYGVKVSATSQGDNMKTAEIDTTTTIYAKTRVLPNYPNPCNPETWIPYQLAKASDVKVTIYAATGEVVRTLALGHQTSGSYHSKSRASYWDGKNKQGETVASGVYFYKLEAGHFSATRKMLILK